MPAPRRSGYFGEYPADMPMPGAAGYPRNDQGIDRGDRVPAGQDRRGTGGEADIPRPNAPRRNQESRPPDEVRGPAPATIIVTLPDDATLMVDDTPTRSTTSRRIFVSPPLEPGKMFHYTLKAEAMRDGKPVTTSQRVEVRAGGLTRVDLSLPQRVAQR
jgi:uncharacterized protein (TIGR03000 family)